MCFYDENGSAPRGSFLSAAPEGGVADCLNGDLMNSVRCPSNVLLARARPSLFHPSRY